MTEPTGRQTACRFGMSENFYGLLREYMAALRELDLCDEQVRASPEGIEREEASSRLALIQKRCVALRREIKRFPAVGSLPRGTAPINPMDRYLAQAG